MFAGKPIIGLAGGIGSGKSFVAKLFGECGGLVISSDEQVHEVYQSAEAKRTLREWWGDGVIDPAGNISRSAVAKIVFSDPTQKQRLESFVHPIVNAARERIMHEHASAPSVMAYIWDIPLLFESHLNKRCDCIVFIDSPQELRRARVGQSRGWSAAELDRRENLQLPLDKKRSISDYIVSNAEDIGVVQEQVRDVFSRILTRFNVKSF